MSRYHLVALIAFVTFSTSAKFYVLDALLEEQEDTQERQRRLELLKKNAQAAPTDTESERKPDADEESEENNPSKIYESTQPRQYTVIAIEELVKRFGPYEK